VEGRSLGFERSYVFIIYVGGVKRVTNGPTFYFRARSGGLPCWGDGPGSGTASGSSQPGHGG
jgi:hypothetical protein